MTVATRVGRPDNAAALLYAHLEVTAPDARSVLLAWPRAAAREISAGATLSAGLVEAYRAAGIDAVLMTLRDQLVTLDELRQTLVRTRLTVVQGDGLLDSPGTIVAARAVDAVVILTGAGRTKRSDLEAARREMASAGSVIAGAVLIG